MDVLTINGNKFMKTATAAKEFGYTPDYVGQLARSGAIAAERVGRTWYVNIEQLSSYKGEKRRSVAAKARASLSARLQAGEHSDGLVRRVSNISYHSDDTPLMPQISRAVPVVQAVQEKAETDYDEVVVNDEFEDLDTVESETVLPDVTQTKKIPLKIIDLPADVAAPVLVQTRNEPRTTFNVTVPYVQDVLPRETSMRKHHLNALYLTILGIALIISATGMYTYTEGTVRQEGAIKTYGIDVVKVQALLRR